MFKSVPCEHKSTLHGLPAALVNSSSEDRIKERNNFSVDSEYLIFLSGAFPPPFSSNLNARLDK